MIRDSLRSIPNGNQQIQCNYKWTNRQSSTGRYQRWPKNVENLSLKHDKLAEQRAKKIKELEKNGWQQSRKNSMY